MMGTQTLEVSDLEPEENLPLSESENSAAEPWGRLWPLKDFFKAIDLYETEYKFGRGEDCDYSFTQNALCVKNPCFNTYSKIHFRIYREKNSNGTFTFLEDKSSNGTFINGEKIGKNKRQALNNNDEICLSLKTHKVFVYMDNSESEDASFPEEIKKKFTMSKLLGRGACGEVRLAFRKGCCGKVAVKIVEKNKFTIGGNKLNMTNQVMQEVNILKALKHPCIIAIEEVIDTPSTLYIVLELVEGGELFDRVVSLGQLDEATAKLLFYQILLAMKYLHDQDITHRDLKPENILLVNPEDAESLIKITDFGLSKLIDENTMLKTFCGTPTYLAPEILLSKGCGSYTKAIDCWSLGVILYICVGGYPPFSDEYKDLKLADQIVKGRYSFPNEFWKGISSDVKNLIKRLLTVDPQKRIGISDALDHPWFKDTTMRENAHQLMYPGVSNIMGPPSQTSRSPRRVGVKRPADLTAETDTIQANKVVRASQETPPPTSRNILKN